MLKKAIKNDKMQIVIMKMLVIFHTNLKFNGLKRRSKTHIEEEKKTNWNNWSIQTKNLYTQ